MAFKRILLRRDTSSNWTSGNAVLASGEVGYETNTGKFKIGNGSTAWTSLGYSIASNISAAVLNDLGDVTITSAANGDFLRWNGTAWVNDAVNLSTDTIGSYVESLVAGTGVTLANNSGEGATPTIAIGQAVATNSNVTFNDLTVAGNLTVSGSTTSINTETLTVNDNFVVLNNNVASAPTENAGIEVERGSATNVQLRWNETDDKWETTNDGTNYYVIQSRVADVTDTEIGYLNGVTSAIQTQIDTKAPLASPTFTGTPISTTAAPGTDTTQIATTAFVEAAVNAGVAAVTIDFLDENNILANAVFN